MNQSIQEERQQRILLAIADIPPGRLSTYGEIARRAGLTGYARYVGYLLRSLPEGTRIPWHRVVNSQGSLSFPAGSPGFEEQARRLRNEGVTISSRGKVQQFKALCHH